MSKLNAWIPGRYLVEDATNIMYGLNIKIIEVELLEVSPTKKRVKIKHINGYIEWISGSKYKVIEDLPDVVDTLKEGLEVAIGVNHA